MLFKKSCRAWNVKNVMNTIVWLKRVENIVKSTLHNLAQEAWHEQKYAGIEEQAVQLWSTSRMMWRCIQRRVETENFAR